MESRTSQALRLAALGFFILLSFPLPLFAQTRPLDLSKAANMGPQESFDGDPSGVSGADKEDGFNALPKGNTTLRGIPFRLLDPSHNDGRSFVVLKGSRKPDFPDAVSIPADRTKAGFLYFLQTCRWGGTGPDVTVAEYDVVYADGAVEIVPLRVGVELTNFFGADDTKSNFLGWWHKYKRIEMGVGIFPWRNPRPEEPIQSILFKSRGRMPVPILLAITTSERELTLAEDSPKPEKESRTDTTGWFPYTPSDASPKGTALDMSFLLDAPAGKHGKVKVEGDHLVFEDGTPARFWGADIGEDWEEWKAEKLDAFLEYLAFSGMNLVWIGPQAIDPEKLGGLVQKANDLGIYVWVNEPINEGLALGKGVLRPDIGISWSLLPGRRNHLMVLHPEEDLFPGILWGRHFGEVTGFSWPPDWMDGTEHPLLMGIFAIHQGLSLLKVSYPDPIPNSGPFLGGAWPVAILAYQRGDLKEGSNHVISSLDSKDSSLKEILEAMARRSARGDGNTKPEKASKAKIDIKNRSFVSDTGQITWQGNVGVVQIEAPRFQAVIGFLANRKFNNPYWSVVTTNRFTSISAISLTKSNLSLSDHILLTGVTQMENTGQVYNEKRTKLLDPGKPPILVEPLAAKFALYRQKADPGLRLRALDAQGQPLPVKVPTKWSGKTLTFSWVPKAFYLELYKNVK